MRFGKEFEITANEGANVCTSFIFSSPRIIFQFLQFELTNSHHFIKITIMLQHTSSYMFRASLLYHQGAQTPETSQCVIHMQQTELCTEYSNRSSSMLRLLYSVHNFVSIYYIQGMLRNEGFSAALLNAEHVKQLFYVLLTVYFSIRLDSDQLDAHLLYFSIRQCSTIILDMFRALYTIILRRF